MLLSYGMRAMQDSLIDGAIAAFAQRFGSLPRFGAIAPGRINLIGEHTDYNGGFVLPMAIDRSTLVLAAPAPQQSTIWAADLNQQHSVKLDQPLAPVPGSFATYVMGVVHGFAARGCKLANLNIMITGNLPRDAGLSSSASLEVATATMLESALNTRLDPVDKALLCQRAERDFANVPCGIMDMFIITMAQANAAMLIDCRSHHHTHVPLPSPDELAIVVVDTGVKRALMAGEYTRRRLRCDTAARSLGVSSLRDATNDMVTSATLSDEDRDAALHVVMENARTLQAAEALRRGDLRAFGRLAFESHRSLRDLFRVSCAELDVVVDAVEQLHQHDANVYGARMTGAGFGGCAIVFCHPRAVAALQSEVRRRFAEAGWWCAADAPRMFTVTAVSGAVALELP